MLRKLPQIPPSVTLSIDAGMRFWNHLMLEVCAVYSKVRQTVARVQKTL